MFRPVLFAVLATIFSSVVFAQDAPPTAYGTIQVRNKKYKATYTLPPDPTHDPSLANDPRYSAFLGLSREEQKEFLERRQKYLLRIAKAMTRSAILAAGHVGLAQDGTLVDWWENSKILKEEPEADDSLVQWWADSQVLDGGGPYGVKTFPVRGQVVVQKFLATIDNLLWIDARNIATGTDTVYAAAGYVAGGLGVRRMGFHLGVGLLPSVMIDRENESIRLRLHLHVQTKDYNPVANLDYGVELGVQVMGGTFTESKAPVDQTGLKKRITQGKMWKLPGAPMVYLYGNGPDQKYDGRTGLLFSQAIVSLPATLIAAAGGPHAAFYRHLPGLNEITNPLIDLWEETLGPSAAAGLGTALQIGSTAASRQLKYWDLSMVDAEVMRYGEDSGWRTYIYNPLKKAWAAARRTLNSFKSENKEDDTLTCLDLGDL